MTNQLTPTDIWVKLAVDVIEAKVLVVSVAKTQTECDAHKVTEVDTPYINTFNLNSKDASGKIAQWLQQCGVTRSDATEVVRSLGTQIGEFIERMQQE